MLRRGKGDGAGGERERPRRGRRRARGERRVAPRRRPRPPLRGRLRRPQPDPHARLDGEAARFQTGDRAWDVDRGPLPGRGREPPPRRLPRRRHVPQADLLPGRVDSSGQANEETFAVRDEERQTPHLDGRVKRIEAKTRSERKQPRGERGEEHLLFHRAASGARGVEMNENGNSASAGDRGMGVALRTLNKLAGSSLLDRIGIRKQFERMVFTTTKGGFRSATTAARTFKASQKLGKPARQKTGQGARPVRPRPDDEQQMFQEAVREFAAEKVRPAAHEADAGRTRRGAARAGQRARRQHARRPRGVGGVMEEQAAVGSVLIGEALAHGDMGIAYAALAPARSRPRSASGARPTRSRPTSPPSPARTPPPPRSRSSSRGPSSTRSSSIPRPVARVPTG